MRIETHVESAWSQRLKVEGAWLQRLELNAFNCSLRLYMEGRLETLCEDYGQYALYKGTITVRRCNFTPLLCLWTGNLK